MTRQDLLRERLLVEQGAPLMPSKAISIVRFRFL
jgi:hypothetical protein